jgi:hypothetical protein
LLITAIFETEGVSFATYTAISPPVTKSIRFPQKGMEMGLSGLIVLIAVLEVELICFPWV